MNVQVRRLTTHKRSTVYPSISIAIPGDIALINIYVVYSLLNLTLMADTFLAS